MKTSSLTGLVLGPLVAICGLVAYSQVPAQSLHSYPPIDNYLMVQSDEIALAKSAAPANVSDHAVIKVLTKSGYLVAQDGSNGWVCMVMRGFSAPTFSPVQFRDLVYDSTVRAPICFNPQAVREVLPYYELRTTLAMRGKDPDEIADGVEAAYATGKLPRREGVSFAYMWSADQNLAPGIGCWHPHVMVFAPYYENPMVGGNTFGAPLPQVTDDAGTPFAVVVIPVDQSLAVKTGMK